jgi:hypothetical protein
MRQFPGTCLWKRLLLASLRLKTVMVGLLDLLSASRSSRYKLSTDLLFTGSSKITCKYQHHIFKFRYTDHELHIHLLI